MMVDGYMPVPFGDTVGEFFGRDDVVGEDRPGDRCWLEDIRRNMRGSNARDEVGRNRE